MFRAVMASIGPRGLLAWRLGLETAHDELASRHDKLVNMCGPAIHPEPIDPNDDRVCLDLHLAMHYTPPPLSSQRKLELLDNPSLWASRGLKATDSAIVGMLGKGLEEERFRVAWMRAREGQDVEDEHERIERMIRTAMAMRPFKGIEEVVVGECEDLRDGDSWELVAVTDGQDEPDLPPSMAADVANRFSRVLAIARPR